MYVTLCPTCGTRWFAPSERTARLLATEHDRGAHDVAPLAIDSVATVLPLDDSDA